jgi:hypothetical protein
MLRPACLLAVLLLCLPGAHAQSPAQPPATPTPAPAPAATPAKSVPDADAATRDPKEPAVQRTRIEDDNARIDELRIRGQTKRITVQPKKGGVPYEVVPLDATRDNSQKGARGAEGQSVWHFLSF